MGRLKRIFEAGELPENEKVYLRKDSFGWRIVQPIKKDVNLPFTLTNINWPNLLFGGWRNLILIVLVLTIVMYHLHEDQLNLEAVRGNCQQIYDNPNGFCQAVCDKDNMKLKSNYNFTWKPIIGEDGVKEKE